MRMNFESQRDNFLVSTDQSKLDIDAIHHSLSRSYWAEGRPREILELAIRNSLCFGLYEQTSEEKENQRLLVQIGFSRVITDYSIYAYLADVYILEQYRGKGLGKWLMSNVIRHPELQTLRRFQLVTRDAHEFYRLFGFTDLREPEYHMEISNDGIYRKANN